ncbi:MAG: PDZ domain-containing protein, partial [Phycisphaerales bacterium JB038]
VLFRSIKKMLHEHAGDLEGHLSMIELDDLNIEKMMKGANMLIGEYAPEGEFAIKTQLAVQPKVMIGITMDDIGPALASHLKLDPKTVTMIQTVVDGQPGDLAGLQAFDIILAADGTHPMTSGHLFKVLQAKEPGDKLALKIMRAGEPMMAVVKLAPWNDKVMAKLSAFEEAEGEYEMQFTVPKLPDIKMPEHLSKELQEKLHKAMSEEHKIVIEKMHQDALKHAEHAKQLQEKVEKIRVTKPKAMEWVEAERVKGDVDERLDKLEDRLDRIEKLLQKLVG